METAPPGPALLAGGWLYRVPSYFIAEAAGFDRRFLKSFLPLPALAGVLLFPPGNYAVKRYFLPPVLPAFVLAYL
jgi:hypothetical protein